MLEERIKRSSKSVRPSSAQAAPPQASRMSPDEKQPKIPAVKTGTVTMPGRTYVCVPYVVHLDICTVVFQIQFVDLLCFCDML